jgi:hypothetical protein
MAIFVNLSTLISLNPISSALTAFAQLCEQYAQKSCLTSALPTFLGKPIQENLNYAWVGYQLHRKTNSLITPYKLGKIGTADFLGELRQTFSFIDADSLDYRPSERNRIFRNKDQFLCLKGKTRLETEDYINALLEHAWNVLINIQDKDIQTLIDLGDFKDDIYLISDTNELNLHAIVTQWNEGLRARNKAELKADLSPDEDGIIKLGPKLHLCPSYLSHTFKTQSANANANNHEDSLIKKLIQAKDLNPKKCVMVSDVPYDVDEALALGFSRKNIHANKETDAQAPMPRKNTQVKLR